MNIKRKLILTGILLCYGLPSYSEWLECPKVADLKVSEEAKPYTHTGLSYFYDNAVDPTSLKINDKETLVRSQLLVIDSSIHVEDNLAEHVAALDDTKTTVSAAGGGLIKCDYFTDDESVYLDTLLQVKGMACNHTHHTGGEAGVDKVECMDKSATNPPITPAVPSTPTT